MNRPSCKGSTVTTPSVECSIELLGRQTFGSIALTFDQLRAINYLYGFIPEKPRNKPKPPKEPKREDFSMEWQYESAIREHSRILYSLETWTDPQALFQAGADRNALRYAEVDGLRIIAWLAKNIPAKGDPLKHVIQLAADAGWDVCAEDIAWANDEPSES